MVTINLKLRICLIGMLYIFSFGNLASQDQKYSPSITPPAPNEYHLGKYLDIPVTNYTGTPSIKIPIHTIKQGDIVLDISLSYHASGIKVDEISSWVGIGWSLSAGGSISRTINSLDDFGVNGYIIEPGELPVPEYIDSFCDDVDWTYGPSSGTDYTQYVRDMIGAQPAGLCARDAEPDNFYFSCGDYSGKFVFDQDGNIHLIPQSDIKILPPHETGITDVWIVYTPDGTKYYFGENDNTGSTASSSDCSVVSQNGGNTSWFLTRIVSPKGDEITFTYLSGAASNSSKSYSESRRDRATRYSFWPFDVESQIGCNNSPPYLYSVCTNTITNYIKVPEYINFNNGSIHFVSCTDRSDHPGDRRLESIEIYKDDDLQRKYDLKTSYSPSDPDYNTCTSCSPEELRLWLHSVVERSPSEEANKQYNLHYISGTLPERGSLDQDFWGYYNNASNSSSYGLIPKMYIDEILPWGRSTTFLTEERIFGVPSYDADTKHFEGADRDPDASAMQIGTLDRIEYPTGGNTEFEYEPDYFKYPIGEYSSYSRPRIYATGSESVSTSVFDIDAYTSRSIVLTYKTDMGTYNNSNGNGGVYIQKYNGSYFYNYLSYIYNTEGIDAVAHLDLSPGRYRVVATAVPNYTLSAEATITWQERVNIVQDCMGGGLRIKTITSNDNKGNTIQKNFDYLDESGTTSGLLMHLPQYSYMTNPLDPYDPTCYRLVRTSSSLYNSQTTGGSPVGYSKVTVFNRSISKNIGKTEYYYTNFSEDQEYASYGRGKVPYTPSTSLAYKNGLLLKQIDYARNSTQPNSNQYYYNIGITKTLSRSLPPGYYTLTYWNKWSDITLSGVDYTIIDQSFGDINTNGFQFIQLELEVSDGGTLEITGTDHDASIDDIKLVTESDIIYAFEDFEDPNWSTWTLSSTSVSQYAVAEEDPYIPVKEVLNQYEYKNETLIRGLRCSGYVSNITYDLDWSLCQRPPELIGLSGLQSIPCWMINYEVFNNVSEWIQRTETEETFFDETGEILQTNKTEIDYNDYGYHKNPILFTSYLSDSRIYETKLKYPLDYTTNENISGSMDDDEAVGISTMIKQNISSIPIEKYELIDNKVTSATLTTFWRNPAQVSTAVPNQSWNFETSQMLDISSTPDNNKFCESFMEYNAAEDKWLFMKDNHYSNLPRLCFTHNSEGNLIQTDKRDDLSTSYIWGDIRNSPIAIIENADQDEVFYTSFESTDQSSWIFNPNNIIPKSSLVGSGDYVYYGYNEAISTSSVVSQRSIISFWGKTSFGDAYNLEVSGDQGFYIISQTISEPNADGWKYYEVEFGFNWSSSIISINRPGSNIWVDELRLYPADAQMTTYTYDLFNGMTSQSDPNGQTTTYEYDDFGRLEAIRDFEGNLLKQVEYNYSND